ncbi:MAG: DUF86 domain-containing protein [Chloroflexota bacterium]|nr:DUF86 domain-containing protein [Chloroflexota bacterium]
MPEENPDDLVRLREMLEAVEKIREILARWSRAVYDEDEVLRLALRYLSLIISEAAFQVSNECKALYPEIPWTQFTGMRQQLVNGFLTSDMDMPWVAEAENASLLAAQLARILQEEFGFVFEPFSLDLYLEEISAYCESQQIKCLSEFAPGFEGWIRPYTDIALLVDYVPNAPITLLDIASHEIDLSATIGKRVCLFTAKGLRQSPNQVPFEIGRCLYEKKM